MRSRPSECCSFFPATVHNASDTNCPSGNYVAWQCGCASLVWSPVSDSLRDPPNESVAFFRLYLNVVRFARPCSSGSNSEYAHSLEVAGIPSW